MALGAAYFAQAAAIEDSLLSDAIGAGGVPKGIAILIGGAGAALLARSLPHLGAAAGARFAAGPHLKALGLLGLLGLYLLLLPLLGYALSILLLAVAVAAYTGAPLRPALLLFGAGTAAVLWAAFVGLLGVPLPQGSLLGG